MLRVLLTLALLLGFAGAACATPSRIIILRHGEKGGKWKLCEIGEERASALAAQYLGRDAKDSLFAGGDKPAAFLAITLHTLELASPAAASWDLPVTDYSVVPDTRGDADEDDDADDSDVDAHEIAQNDRTREAAHDVLTDPRFNGKTVVMVWEHKHIASAKLEGLYPGKDVTLRQLLKLDALKDVPETWPGDTYDYFWIVDYAPGSDRPTGFKEVRQDFSGRYSDLPDNDWDESNGLTRDSGCKVKGSSHHRDR